MPNIFLHLIYWFIIRRFLKDFHFLVLLLYFGDLETGITQTLIPMVIVGFHSCNMSEPILDTVTTWQNIVRGTSDSGSGR